MSEMQNNLVLSWKNDLPSHPGEGVAVISDGSPRLGNDKVTVFAVEIFKANELKKARAWFRQMEIEQPWRERS